MHARMPSPAHPPTPHLHTDKRAVYEREECARHLVEVQEQLDALSARSVGVEAAAVEETEEDMRRLQEQLQDGLARWRKAAHDAAEFAPPAVPARRDGW